MRLNTFVHISDIHITDARMDAQVAALYVLFPKLDGFLGHSYDSLTKLDPFFDNLKNKEDARLILTGDLTRVGAQWEFETAQEFLETELTPPKGESVGLSLSNWRELTIPGNHDRYPGIPFLFGGPTKAFYTIFPSVPIPSMPTTVDIPLHSSNGHLLKFLLIDTDADVSPWSPNRAAAKGSFVSQLQDLSGQLNTQASDEIRVLCLHHSRAKGGLLLRMDSQSSAALDEFIVSHGVAVLLSGHIHEPPSVKLATAHGSSGSTEYLEARCGTTSQMSLFHKPHYWRNLYGLHIKKNPKANSLLVHRIYEINGEILWESELFREGSSDFVPANTATIVDPKIRLWPAPIQKR